MTQPRLPPLTPPSSQGASRAADNAAEQGDADRYGNKTANLSRLQAMIGQSAKVPPFRGIDTDDVKAYLGPQCREKIEALRAQLRKDGAAPGSTLSAESRAALQQVRREIVAAFTGQHGLPGGDETLSWLHAQDGFSLMVRSTGREDTDTVTNAGGNESIANVQPTVDAVKAAMAKVLASYFSEKSFQQRMVAGDDMLGEPFVPVLLQRMVGERPDGKVPSSGVLFTRESEGPTAGVSQIQTTFGHNEAVVAGLVPADTFLVDDASIRTIVRRKTERLVPAVGGGLKPASNPGTMRLQPAITEDVATRLHQLGKVVSAHFGKPMDIEWTFDPESDTIYLLQARPLGLNASAAPNHIDAGALAKADVLQGDVLGAAGGVVRQITRPQEVILAPTLAEALRIYLDGPRGGGTAAPQIKAVVISEVAEATSHEATTFRGASVPVVRIGDLAEVRAYLGRHDAVLLDTARGAFAAGPAIFADGRPKDGIVRDGWAKHPLPARLTTSTARDADEAQRTLGAFARGVAADLNLTLEAAQDASPMRALHALLQQAPAAAAPSTAAAGGGPNGFAGLLAAIDQADNAAAKAQAWLALLRAATQLGLALRGRAALQGRVDAVVRQLFDAAARAYAAEKSQPGGIEALYQRNWLSALVAQDQTPDAVQTDSLAGLAAEHKELVALARAAGGAPQPTEDGAAYAIAAARLGRFTPRPELAQAWRTFADACMGSAAGRASFARLVVDLQTLGIAPVWLNTVFAARTPNSLTPAAAAALGQRFSAELRPANGDAAKAAAWAEGMRAQLGKWRGQIGAWADPAQAATLQAAFVQDLATPMRTEGPALFANASQAQQLVLVAMLEQVVDLFDQTIKSVSGSTDFADGAKVRLFTALLAEYGQLLPAWLEVAAPALAGQRRAVSLAKKTNLELAKASAAGMLGLHRQMCRLLDNPIDDYFDEQARNNMGKTLHPSALFDVRLAKLGNSFSSTSHGPKTAEDYFTFTHQSLLQIVAAANVHLGLSLDKMPPNLETFARAVLGDIKTLDDKTHPFASELVSVNIDAAGFLARINVPMREHGIQLELMSTANKPEQVRCKVTYSSRVDEHARLCRSRLAAFFLAAGNEGQFVSGDEPSRDKKRGVVSWNWQFTPGKEDAAHVAERLRTCLNYINTTSYAPAAADRSLMRQLDAFAQFCPDPHGRLGALDEAFFLRYPWHNDEFFTYFVEHDMTATPAFSALCAAIAKKPAEQDRMWEKYAYDIPKASTVPKALELLRRWQQGAFVPAATEGA